MPPDGLQRHSGGDLLLRNDAIHHTIQSRFVHSSSDHEGFLTTVLLCKRHNSKMIYIYIYISM